jgi:hypothetical protein
MLRKLLGLSIVFGLFTMPVAQAAIVWVGTADYSKGPYGDGTDGEVVGPFDSYDLGPGVALTQGVQGAAVDDVLNGYFQSYVTDHTRNSVPVAAPNLNDQGTGGGYELTVAASFMEKITAVGATTTFDMTGGSVGLYLGASPDYDFDHDTGFNDDGSILSGTIVGGGGSFSTTPSYSFGGALIDVRVDTFDSAVFDPDTIAAGTSVFTLQITPTNATFLSTVESVQGHAYDANNDLLVVADGNFDLLAVPEPLSVLLVGSAVGGLAVMRRRIRS